MSHYSEQREAELTVKQEQDISSTINGQDSLFSKIFKKLNQLESRIERLSIDVKNKNDTE